MGILIKRKGDIPALTGIAKLSVVSLFATISAALVDTIWALYIDSFVHSESIVGFISAALTLLSIASYFFFIPLIEKNSKSRIFSVSILIFGISYILFSVITNFYFFLILASLVTVLYTFRTTSFGIIVRDKSKRLNISRNEGLIYTVANFAYVIGPLIAGFIAAEYSLSYVFILSAFFIFLALIFFKSSGIKDLNISRKIHKDTFINFRRFFEDRQRTLTYFISGGVNMWWSFIYLFVPLYIVRSNLSDLWVGYFLFAVAVPLILTEYKFSKLTSKIGHRRIFKVGYSFVAIVSLVCFFISNIYILLGLLVLASFGMAMLEPTTEAYFFKILKKKSDENRFYGPYNTTIDFSGFIGRISGALVLLVLPFRYLFILYSVFMFVMFVLSSKINNVY